VASVRPKKSPLLLFGHASVLGVGWAVSSLPSVGSLLLVDAVSS